MTKQLKLTQFSSFLKARSRDAHKGLYGHTLIVGGDAGFAGAPLLAASAALRVGAGLVSIATRDEHAVALTAFRPEVMCHGVNAIKNFAPLIAKATVIVLGPGLGQSPWAKKLLAAAIKSQKPLVVDADALNLLAKKPSKHSQWILTPHPGEAARLLQQTTTDIQQARLQAIKKIQKKFGGICILKGAGSLILTPDEEVAECSAGNPGMATAGMGDVLSGVLGGLLSQGIPAAVAAKLGVLVHATAGDLAAKNGERGLIASDLLPYLRQLVNL